MIQKAVEQYPRTPPLRMVPYRSEHEQSKFERSKSRELFYSAQCSRSTALVWKRRPDVQWRIVTEPGASDEMIVIGATALKGHVVSEQVLLQVGLYLSPSLKS